MTSLALQRVDALFPAPLAVFDIADAPTLNARLLQEALARREASAGLQRSNLQGWHSDDDFFRRSEPGAAALRRQIVEAVFRCSLQVAPGFDAAAQALQAEGWINVCGRGGMNTPHDHPGWVWSGCYYVQMPAVDNDTAGAIEFLDPRTNVRTLTVDGAQCFAGKHRLQPRAGQMLLFPSWLRHWVYPNDSDALRVTIAFNARFVRNAPPSTN